jgi:hypothetical protein
MSASNRFVGFYQYNHKYDTSSLSQFVPYEHRSVIMTPSQTRKIEWQKLFGNSLVMSLQYGFWTYDSKYVSFAPREVPPSFDSFTGMNLGPFTTVGQRPHNPRHHYRGAVSWFKPEMFVGNHEFKFGFDYTDSWFGRQYPRLDPNEKLGDAFASWIYNYRLRFNNGQADRLEVWNNPAMAKGVVHYLGLYGQDSWTIGRRLTLNLGVRYAHDNGFVPESCREAAEPPGHVAFPATCFERKQFNIWNTVAPRLHASFDVTGDGRTVIKGGWGRFDHRRQEVPELSDADPHVRTTVTYRWRDANNNRNYDPGEVNLDPTRGTAQGGDFISQSGGSNTFPNPDEREPKSDEFSLSIERELFASFAVRVTGLYSNYQDIYRTLNVLRPYEAFNIPVTRPDPGRDGVVGNADDPGVSFTYWEYAPELSGRQFERLMLVNDPKANQSFSSIDLAVFKRLSNRWQLLASYSATKRNVPIAAGGAGTEFNANVNAGSMDPNAEINAADREWEWTGKISGVYILPHQVMLSTNYEHRSGNPWARTVEFRGGRTIPVITLRVEPIGAQRLPHTNQVDFRVEKSFNVTRGHRAALRMNVFNLLNSDVVLGVRTLSSSTFGLPTDIMPPRVVEFGMTYSF